MMEHVDRLRYKEARKLRELAKTHLAFVMHFDDTDWQLDQDFAAAAVDGEARKGGPLKDHSNKKSPNSLFGSPLTHEGVCVIYQLIDFIGKERNITQEGIFRKSGSASRQAELRQWLNCGTTIDLDNQKFTVHDCATVLKSFLAELPEPLLTEALFKVYCQVVAMEPTPMAKVSHSKLDQKAKQLKAYQLLTLLIPDVNRQLLRDVITLLKRVAENSDSNKMDSQSLATLFSPHLLLPKRCTPVDMHKHLDVISMATCQMIDNADRLFEAPLELIHDVTEYLKTIASCDSLDQLDDAPVNTLTFCQQNPNEANSTDLTQLELAKLYAHVRNMPKSTPGKDKWIKKFNKESGQGTPKTHNFKIQTESAKKTGLFNGMLKAGQNLFRGGAARSSRKVGKERSASLEGIASPETDKSKQTAKQIFKRSSSIDNSLVQSGGKKSCEVVLVSNNNIASRQLTSSQASPSSQTPMPLMSLSPARPSNPSTPLGLSFESANKRVKKCVFTPGNRDPVIM